MEALRAAGGDGPRSATGRVSLAMHIAARPAAQRTRGRNSRSDRHGAGAGCRWAPLLRLRGHVFDPPARAVATAQDQHAARHPRLGARPERAREHWLPQSSCERHAAAGASLGGDFRRAAACALMIQAAQAYRADYRRFLAIPTRWMDNDIYGHVNNVAYYSYFDTAVNEHLIGEGGLDIRAGPAMGLVVA